MFLNDSFSRSITLFCLVTFGGTDGELVLGLTGNDEGIADRIGDEFGGFFLTGHGGGVGGGVFSTLVTLERVRRAGSDGTDGGLGLGLNEDNEGVAGRESFWRLSPRFPAYSRKTDRII